MPHPNHLPHLFACLLAIGLGASVHAQQPVQPIAPEPIDAAPADHGDNANPAQGKAEIAWHGNYQEAFDAAAKTGKPVFVFVYLPLEKSCVEMARRTLKAEAVVKALANFECCATSVRDREAKPFIDQFHVGPARGQVGERFQATPVSLFIGPDGTEYLRQTGYLDSVLFELQVQRLLRLLPDLAAARANPKDAATLARIGRKYIEMTVFQLGRAYLQRAVEADPDDAAGVKSDAGLDLIITSMDDRDDKKTQKAFEDLAEFVANHPDSPRRREARFYMAAAQIVLGNDSLAKKLLAEFAARGPDSPDAQSEWGQKAIPLWFDLLADEIGELHRVEFDSKGKPVKFKRDDKEIEKAARAQREMREYMKLFPDSPRRFDARYYGAVAQIKLGQRESGEKLLRALAAGGPDAPDPKSDLAKRATDILDALRSGAIE